MQPTSISHIVARAYLNHQRGKRYINKLLQQGHLKRHNTKYITTEKGEELLLYYHRIKTLLGETAGGEGK
ncbi:MAG: hypothetical protein DRP08_03500 [Candidatus Aenigmatarchaeota archaeon]|nr:MAG: hypothetical protein DRP08_03500 [Candidatus Aenigmarchaeota archaeon]